MATCRSRTSNSSRRPREVAPRRWRLTSAPRTGPSQASSRVVGTGAGATLKVSISYRPQEQPALAAGLSDAEFSALPITGRHQLFGRHKLGQTATSKRPPPAVWAPCCTMRAPAATGHLPEGSAVAARSPTEPAPQREDQVAPLLWRFHVPNHNRKGDDAEENAGKN